LNVLTAIAGQFSPRYETRSAGAVVVIDVAGLDRLIGPPPVLAQELAAEAFGRGVTVHVAIARTQTAAVLLASARPGTTVAIEQDAAAAVAALPIATLGKLEARSQKFLLLTLHRWGLKTIGDVARLPAADFISRFGPAGRIWHALACGEDFGPLVPDRLEERFEASLDLDWPIEEIEPLAFVFTRLLEPLSLRLEARDRGVARLHTELRLVTKERHARCLELPAPMRDARTLRTLVVLDLESHPPAAAVDRVSITIDPTPGRIVQHALFTRPHPTPEQLATLVARLGAVMGQDRIGAPAAVDSYRPDDFAMRPFAIDHDQRRGRGERREDVEGKRSAGSALNVVAALRRFRRPIPARVAVERARPVRVTTDRAEIRGGVVRASAGPWRSSGHWWADEAGGAGRWDRDEWDVALADGAVYRVFQDRHTDRWFIEAIAD